MNLLDIAKGKQNNSQAVAANAANRLANEVIQQLADEYTKAPR